MTTKIKKNFPKKYKNKIYISPQEFKNKMCIFIPEYHSKIYISLYSAM